MCLYFTPAPSGRSSGRKSRRSLVDELPSPSPSRKQRLDRSPGSSDLQPLPSSPPSGQAGAEESLFSSPRGKRYFACLLPVYY